MEKKIEDLELMATVEAGNYMLKIKLRELNNPRIPEHKWKKEVKVIMDDIITAKKGLNLSIEKEEILMKELGLAIDKTTLK